MKLLYSVDEAARQLSLGRAKTWELVGSGAIRSVKCGSRRLVPAEALEDFVASLAATHAS